MKAMILCAGLGTRLKPWTLSHPKALVPVKGVPMLKRVMANLSCQGFDEVVVNVHHFASQIVDYIEKENLPTRNVMISDESDCLLDTGGGILKAKRFLSADDRPFLVHNVDILSNADLNSLYNTHIASHSDITLLVSDRESSRKLIFDQNMHLKGWMNIASGENKPSDLVINEQDREMAFSGIYVMSPIVFDEMERRGFNGKFPVMDFLLNSIGNLNIIGFCQEGLKLIDIGKPDSLNRANLQI